MSDAYQNKTKDLWEHEKYTLLKKGVVIPEGQGGEGVASENARYDLLPEAARSALEDGEVEWAAAAFEDDKLEQPARLVVQHRGPRGATRIRQFMDLEKKLKDAGWVEWENVMRSDASADQAKKLAEPKLVLVYADSNGNESFQEWLKNPYAQVERFSWTPNSSSEEPGEDLASGHEEQVESGLSRSRVVDKLASQANQKEEMSFR